MTAVLGLDLSVTRSGVALPDGRTMSIAGGTAVDVAARLHTIAGRVAYLARRCAPAVVVLEGYSHRSVGILSTIRLAELGGAVRVLLHELDIPYVEIPPAQLKRWATGNGNADKDRMLTAARAAGGQPANHDEADAYLLRAVALHALDRDDLLDHQPDHRPARLDVIANVAWPALHP